jgi:hypothetical protein
MLVIRDEQLEIFGEILGFEAVMLEHLKESFSLPYEMLGKNQIRRIVQYGSEKAESYGFVGRQEKCIYINAMMLLGSDFDQDFQLPWMPKLLKENINKEPIERVEYVYSEILIYLEHVAGLKNKFMIRAIEKIREIKIQNLIQPSNISFESGINNLLAEIYPEKSKYQGSSVMNELIQNGIKKSKEYGLKSYRNVVVFTTMMFMLGSGFDDDLQFPWATKALNDKSIKDQNLRTQRLYKLAMMLLNRSLAQVNS